ncbi:MAG: transglycosylase SLT domain-containing protein [Deltaproteobacteria bacterium]|nr:transglycosylase SLT domain-containing protein [Deltaproteobacteria bacterium]
MMHRESMRMRRVMVLALLILFAGSGGARGQEQNEAQDVPGGHFPYPAALRPQVEFWKKIFATYSRYQVVIHDTERLNRVYKVLDFRPLLDEEGPDEATVLRTKDQQTKKEIEKIRATLLKLHQRGDDEENLGPEEQKIWNLYRDANDPDKFHKAADEDRLRSQSGLRERFREGIQVSRRYLKEMEDIFRREGVPVELTRLPLVESCFNLQAYSKAAAAGIWQFIPSTGRLYMRIDGVIDQRRDPLVSTWAAARLLKTNYELLDSWPLAITAYNHGLYGVFKAAHTLGTRDIAEIVRRYKGKGFGFASKNFYAEFLAALEVEKNYQQYFGSLRLEPPLRYDEVHLKDFISLKHAADCANTDEEQLLFLNPALEEPVRNGRAYVPRGYRLRVPDGTSPLFLERYAALQDHEKADRQKAVFVMHKIRRGQTLQRIARQYNTTILVLKRLNGVSNVKRLQIGQTLRVPTS